MVHRILTLSIGVLLAVTASAIAGGSVFSANGVGEEVVQGGARSLGLGGGAYGLADSTGFNATHPALSALVHRVTFRVGGQTAFWTTSARGRRDSDTEFSWQDFQICLPLSRKWTLGLAAEPSSRMDVKSFSRHQSVFDDADTGIHDTVEYEQRDSYLGSTVDLRIDNAFKLSDRLAVGISAIYVVRRLERTSFLDLPSFTDHAYYLDTDQAQAETFRGWSAAVGVHYQVTPRLGVGAVYRPRYRGEWTRETTLLTSAASAKQSREGPAAGAAALGFAYRLGNKLVGVVDGRVGQWSSEDLSMSGWVPAQSEVRDPFFLSVGVERSAGRAPQRSGLDLWAYRTGLFYRRHYWVSRTQTSGSSAPVEDVGLAFGLSIPVAIGQGWLHWAAEIGKRGLSEDDLGASETFLRFTGQLEISETWFQRARSRVPR